MLKEAARSNHGKCPTSERCQSFKPLVRGSSPRSRSGPERCYPGGSCSLSQRPSWKIHDLVDPRKRKSLQGCWIHASGWQMKWGTEEGPGISLLALRTFSYLFLVPMILTNTVSKLYFKKKKSAFLSDGEHPFHTPQWDLKVRAKLPRTQRRHRGRNEIGSQAPGGPQEGRGRLQIYPRADILGIPDRA